MELPTVEWASFDLDTDPEPPDYLVDGLIQRGDVGVLSADTGVGKTWVALDLTRATLQGDDWLDRPVRRGGVVVIDNENSQATIHARLRAMGVSNDEQAALHYASRQGVLLGQSEWDEWLAAVVSEHDPALVVLDSLMATTALEDVNDNTEIVDLYNRVLRPLTRSGAAVLILHHHRKQASESGQAALGARQIIGQAEFHLRLSAMRTGADEEEEDDRGARTVSTQARFDVEKLRADVLPSPVRVRIESMRESDGRFRDALVINEGPLAEAAAQRPDDARAQAVAELLRERGGTLRTAEIKEALDLDDGPCGRALTVAVRDGLIEREGHGRYRAPSREEVGL